MTPATAIELDQRTVEQFLFTEARLADDHDYDGWEALWTDDALYWVPASADDDADPWRQMSVIHDNRHRIATRVKQLKTGRRHAQSPKSRLCRVVSNVQLLGPAGDRGDLEVQAAFVLVEARQRGTEVWAGRCTYRLRLVDGALRMSSKKVSLVDADGVLATLSFLI